MSVTDAPNSTTTYAYEAQSNLTSITSANSHATTFAFVAFGRAAQTNFPSNKMAL